MKNFSKVIAVLLWVAIAVIIFTTTLNSCKASKEVVTDIIYHRDTIPIVDYRIQDSLSTVLQLTRDTLKRYRDSIEYEDYINARRIEKVKYYINICEKNSKQKKYFYGWIKRAVSE